MKFSFKSIKKFLWKYKYVITLLLLLFIIYYYINVYIQENLEITKVTTRTLQFPSIKNTSTVPINIEVFSISYNGKVNTTKPISNKTQVESQKEFKLTDYDNHSLESDLGFAVRLSSVDGSAKKLNAEIWVCSVKKVPGKSKSKSKQFCNTFKPNIANYSEISNFNFKVNSDKTDVIISEIGNTNKWKIDSVKEYPFLSIGFKFN